MKGIPIVNWQPLFFNADSDFADLNRRLETRSLATALGWCMETFGQRMAQVTSFGPAGMVILDHLMQLREPSGREVRVITVDTGFLFGETYALWAEVEQRYGLRIDVQRSELSTAGQARRYGPKLWEMAPDYCCHIRKVAPLGNALCDLDLWISGVRRDQSPTRAHTPFLAWDTKYRLLKLNPLAGWTRDDVWRYIRQHNLPYNQLHDQGYTSIGCTHCTRPATDARDERSGRWVGASKTECGLHWPTQARN